MDRKDASLQNVPPSLISEQQRNHNGGLTPHPSRVSNTTNEVAPRAVMTPVWHRPRSNASNQTTPFATGTPPLTIAASPTTSRPLDTAGLPPAPVTSRPTISRPPKWPTFHPSRQSTCPLHPGHQNYPITSALTASGAGVTAGPPTALFNTTAFPPSRYGTPAPSSRYATPRPIDGVNAGVNGGVNAGVNQGASGHQEDRRMVGGVPLPRDPRLWHPHAIKYGVKLSDLEIRGRGG